MLDEKTSLNNEYQKLNKSHQQNLKEQTDLLVLCSTYEDQLKTCRNIIQSARLTVNATLALTNDRLSCLGTEFSTGNGQNRMNDVGLPNVTFYFRSFDRFYFRRNSLLN